MELLVLAVVVLVLFGGKKIPELFRGLGQGVGELKKGLEEGKQGLSDLNSSDKKVEEKTEAK